jgi:hypothetical protein
MTPEEAADNRVYREQKRNEERHKESYERIKLVDDGGQTLLYIYEVDGHEYIANSRGGIIHSESCPCKKKN